MNKSTLLILSCALLTVSSFAQDTPACSPAGTWYGGGDYHYILTITPNADGSFAVRGEGAYSVAALGYTAGTSFSSQMRRVTTQWYVGMGSGLYTTSSDPLPPPESIELDAVRGWTVMTDCNHLRVYYDFFAAYFDLGKVPFVDPPDLNYVPPGGIQETYRRIPDECPICGRPPLPGQSVRQKH